MSHQKYENVTESAKRLTKQAYDRYGVNYSIYEGNDRFKGTPIPSGYKAVYVPADDFIPDSLMLEKVKD